MTREEKIKWLKRYEYSQSQIERKQQQIEKWREQAHKAGATISDMPKGGGAQNKVEELVVKIVDRQREITQELTEQIQLQRDIEQAIATVEDEAHKELLACRYIDCLTFEKIGEKMKYSITAIKYKHLQAIDNLLIVSF